MATLRSIFLAIGLWTFVLVGLDLFLESSAFLGIILPGDTVVILMGLLAGGGVYSFKISLGLVLGCAFMGDTSGYLLGRYAGDAVLKRVPWVKHHYDATKDRFMRYKKRFGAWVVLIGRFLPVIRTVTPFGAGFTGMALWKFLPVALLASFVWGSGWFFLGWAFGSNWHSLEDIIKPLGIGVSVIYLIVVILALAWHNRHALKRLWDRLLRHLPDSVRKELTGLHLPAGLTRRLRGWQSHLPAGLTKHLRGLTSSIHRKS